MPARWTRATAQVFVTLTRGSNVLRFNTKTAQTETGTWRWVVKGAQRADPGHLPGRRYRVQVRVEVKHGGKRVASAAHAGAPPSADGGAPDARS